MFSCSVSNSARSSALTDRLIRSTTALAVVAGLFAIMRTGKRTTARLYDGITFQARRATAGTR